MTVGVPLTAEDAVLLLDVGSTQDDVLTPLSVRLANPASTGEEAILERARERERGREREGERERAREREREDPPLPSPPHLDGGHFRESEDPLPTL